MAKKLIRLDFEELRHNNRMLELNTEFENKKALELLHHDLELQRQRIREAGIRKSIERKANLSYMNGYSQEKN